MKNTRKRLLASLLALCMTVGLLPAQAVQSDTSSESPDAAVTQTEPAEEAAEEEPTVKHEAAFLASYATSGTCGAEGDGSNITWILDSVAGTFTLSGTGAMAKYSGRDYPWYDASYEAYRNDIVFDLIIGEGITCVESLNAYLRIRSVTFPSTLTSIGDGTFASQKNLTEVVIPATVTSIGDSAFSMSGLEKVTLTNPCADYGIGTFQGIPATQITLPEGMTTIPEQFLRETKLTSVTIPSTVTSIGKQAFNHCAGLTEVSLPEGLTEIGPEAFSSCDQLATVNLPSTLKVIDDQAFAYCSLLTFGENGFPHPTAMLDGGRLGFQAFSNTSVAGTLTIPDTVTHDDGVFWGTKITDVKWPSTEEKLGKDIIAECDYITSVTIPDGWKVYNQTNNCSSLEQVSLPDSIETIGAYAFNYCEKLTSIELPANLKTIGSYAFSHCTSLKEIIMPDTVVNVDVGASGSFTQCASLEYVKLSDNITSLYQTFQLCSSLKTVELPKNLSTLNGAFNHCAALEHITIPENVIDLGKATFLYTNLKQARCLGDAPGVYAQSHRSASFPNTTTIYYTAGKSGWTTPKWNGYPCYPVLGAGDAEFHDGGYYAPIDLYHFSFESEGKSLDGVTISYQGASLTCETGQSEISAGLSPVAGEFITFTREGYHDVSMPTEVLDAFNTVLFMPESVTKPFVQAIYGTHGLTGYTDMLHQTMHFFAASPEEKTAFYVDVNWNGHPEGNIYLSQSLLSEKKYDLNNGFCAPGYLSVDLQAGGDLYLFVTDDSNTHQVLPLSVMISPVQLDFDLNIGELEDPPAISAGDETSGKALISKFDFGFDFIKNVKANVTIENDGTIKVLLGAAKEEPFNETDHVIFGTLKDSMAYGKNLSLFDLMKLTEDRRSGFARGKRDFFIESEIIIAGYLEGKLIPANESKSGKPEFDFYEGSVFVSLDGKSSTQFQLYLSGYPFYFNSELGNKFDFTVPILVDTDEGRVFISGDPALKIKTTPSLNLEVGFGWDSILSAGVYGKAEGELGLMFPFHLDKTYAKLTGSFGLEAEVFGFETDIELFPFYDEYLWGKDNASSYALRRMSRMDFSPASRDYMDAPAPVSLLSVDEENTTLTQSMIDDGIYPSADVQFLTTESGCQYAVWTDDPGESVRPEANNRTKLYYTYRYKPSSKWSNVCPLINPTNSDDDGTADFNPVLKEVDDTVYALWQNANRPLTADDTVDTIPGLLDISCASCPVGTGTFTLLDTVGTEYYDTAATVCAIDGTAYAVWVSNSASSVFEGADTYSIHRQVLSEDAEIETLITGLNLVDALETDGKKIWYSTDTDAEGSALTDYAVFCYDGEAATQVSDAGATKPALVNGVLTWYENGSIRIGEQSVALALDTDRYQYLVSPAGMEAVIYTVDSDIRQTTLYASFNDGTGWGNPIPLSGVTGNIKSFDAAFDSNGAVCVLVCERGLNPEAANYLSGTATLNLYTVTPYADLAITNATYLGQSLVRGGTLDLVVNVVNNGMSAANLINVTALNGSVAQAATAYEHFLPSGQSAQLYISVPLDEPTALTDLKVQVTTIGYTDHTPDDNIAPVTLRLSDVSVEGSQLTGSGESLTAHTMVVNRGQTNLTNLTVNLYAEDGETVLATQSIAALEPGKGEVISFPVTPGAEAQLLRIRASAADLDVTQENMAANNEVTIRVASAQRPVPPVSIISNVAKNDDSTVSAAAYITGSADSVYGVYIAGYDSHGRMVDIITSDSTYTDGTLVGQDIVKVKIIALDQNLNPVADVREYDV